MDLSDNLKESIRAEAAKTPDAECCGIIVTGETLKPCHNVSPAPKTSFVIGSSQLAELAKVIPPIAFYHSHVGQETGFSLVDRYVSEQVKLPSVIYHLPTDSFKVYEPMGFEVPLLGRPYFRGALDCNSLVKDYYKRTLNIEIEDIWAAGSRFLKMTYDQLEWLVESMENPEKHGQVGHLVPEITKLYYQMLSDSGFSRVETLQEHDMVLIKSNYFNAPVHVMVYIGRDTVIHHPAPKTSVMTRFTAGYSKSKCEFYRHNLCKN